MWNTWRSDHRSDERGHCGDRAEVRDVPAAQQLAVLVRDGTDDQRVQHDGVDHRHERDETAAHLADERRFAVGDREVAVDGTCGCRPP
jgi:hypothetical protein